MKKKVYILFGFDMESDNGNYTRNYEGAKSGTPKILEVLNKNNVKATFLFTGDTAENNKQVVYEVYEGGFEIGCHGLMHETLDIGQTLYSCPGDIRIRPRLEKNIQIIEKIIKDRPVSFRAPRLWQTNEQVKILEDLGFLVDASYWQLRYKKQILPYHPSKDNWLEKGDLRILELPNFYFINNSELEAESYVGLDQFPKLRTKGAEFVFNGILDIIDNQLKISDIGVIVFYLHPWEAIEISNKLTYDEGTFYFHKDQYLNTGDYFVKQLDLFIEKCIDREFKFASFKEFYDFGYF